MSIRKPALTDEQLLGTDIIIDLHTKAAEQRYKLELDFLDEHKKAAQERGEDPEKAQRDALSLLAQKGWRPSPGLFLDMAYKLSASPKEQKRDEKLAQIEVKRQEVEAAKAGGLSPREAWDQVAKRYGHNSGEALRKALQPNRVNRLARRHLRG